MGTSCFISSLLMGATHFISPVGHNTILGNKLGSYVPASICTCPPPQRFALYHTPPFQPFLYFVMPIPSSVCFLTFFYEDLYDIGLIE